jgi:hypothetical protein
MKIYPEHELEATPGLPEPLPPGERLLWQGRPDWRQLARDAFHVDVIGVYFLLMILLQALLSWRASDSLATNLMPLLTSAALALAALGLLLLSAWLSARTTLYTLTSKRIVMRIGIVLTVSFNLPLRWIAAAHLKPGRNGSGDIALELKGSDRIAWLHLWPHARAWHLRKPQPSLRCLPDAERTGELLQRAWRERLAQTGDIDVAERIPVRMPAAAMAR